MMSFQVHRAFAILSFSAFILTSCSPNTRSGGKLDQSLGFLSGLSDDILRSDSDDSDDDRSTPNKGASGADSVGSGLKTTPDGGVSHAAGTEQAIIVVEHEQIDGVYIVDEGEHINFQVRRNMEHPDNDLSEWWSVPGQPIHEDSLGYEFAEFGWYLSMGESQPYDYRIGNQENNYSSTAHFSPGQLVAYVQYIANMDVKCEDFEAINVIFETASYVESIGDDTGNGVSIPGGGIMYRVLIRNDDAGDCE